MRVYRQYIDSPTARRARRQAQKQRNEAIRESQRAMRESSIVTEDENDSFKPKYVSGPWGTYARHWYAGGRIA